MQNPIIAALDVPVAETGLIGQPVYAAPNPRAAPDKILNSLQNT